uniref:Plastid-encoded RNA polymerase subunit alpha n=1 Tax=Oogamochlamys gigantea TaxID=158507 RepID=A0A0S2LNS1_9CHLO|nr:alpha subunit of RNA polymerase [Oogamochlamys gigantea]ALO62808.1 alpha subunit of RNA polymerase [Oogamochlamys gigantea]
MFVQEPFFIGCKKLRIETNTCFYGCFYLGPFDPGQSITIANALRRTLLSELRGIAITSVEIDGAFHEYSILPGIQDSVLDILLNLKEVVLKLNRNSVPFFNIFNTQVGYLRARGPGIVRAADLKIPPYLQCVNPEQYIATLSEDGVLNMKFFINEGKNYHLQTPAKSAHFTNVISNPLLIDAIFMPVLKVSYIIESNEQANDFLTPFHKFESESIDDGVINDNKIMHLQRDIKNVESNLVVLPVFFAQTKSEVAARAKPKKKRAEQPSSLVGFPSQSPTKNLKGLKKTVKLVPCVPLLESFGQPIGTTELFPEGNKKRYEKIYGQCKSKILQSKRSGLSMETGATRRKKKSVILKGVTFQTNGRLGQSELNNLKQSVVSKSKTGFRINYVKTAQSKIDLKHNILLEIWTNGSLHPREALYYAIKNLLLVFSKLKRIKFFGSVYKSEKNYKKFLELFVKKWKNQATKIAVRRAFSFPCTK